MKLKDCPKCRQRIASGVPACPECGFIFDDLNETGSWDEVSVGRTCRHLGWVLFFSGLAGGHFLGLHFFALSAVGVGVYIYGRFQP